MTIKSLFLPLLAAALASAPCLAASPKGGAFPREEFSKVRPLLCGTSGKVDKSLEDCDFADFQFMPVDLDGKGTTAWLAFGPRDSCGAHGNCPVQLLRQGKAGGFERVGSAACVDSSCLNSGNRSYSEVSSSTHHGYRDLWIASDHGPFLWVKNLYEWDGVNYRLKPKSIGYFFYDQDKDGLVKVDPGPWQNCRKNGRDCP